MTQHRNSQSDASTGPTLSGRRTAAGTRAADSPILLVPGEWAERALCTQADPDTWFPEPGHRGRAAAAKRICGACPVRAERLEYALSGADTWRGIANGIWAGTTARERARLRQARKAEAA